MHTHLSAALVLTMAFPHPVAAQASEAGRDYPQVDSRAYCDMIAKDAAHLRAAIADQCMKDEREVSAEARSRWDAATEETRSRCTDLARLNGLPSDQLILGCIRYLEHKI